jgi:hypothetical protein
MVVMLIAVAIILFGVLAFVLGAIALGERNHRLVAREEGLDPEPADFTDIDLSDDGDLSPTPERTPEEFREVAQALSATLSAPEAPAEPEEAPPEPGNAPEPHGEGWDVVTGPMAEVPSLPYVAREEVVEDFKAGSLFDPTKIATIGPGDRTREQPDDPEVVLPLRKPAVDDLVERIAGTTAGKPPGEFKKWNKQ